MFCCGCRLYTGYAASICAGGAEIHAAEVMLYNACRLKKAGPPFVNEQLEHGLKLLDQSRLADVRLATGG